MFTRRTLFLAVTALPIPTIERRVFDAINFQRVSQDSDPLAWDPRLCLAARDHSRRMIAAGFFGHVDPRFGDLVARLERAGIRWTRCAENVFQEKNFDDPVALAVVEWMYSPGHRRNLLNTEFTLTGVGVATGHDGRTAITQQFLIPLDRPRHQARPKA
jgi:uncharacterized protein YkwD